MNIRSQTAIILLLTTLLALAAGPNGRLAGSAEPPAGLSGPGFRAPGPVAADAPMAPILKEEKYSYGGARFTELVADSYRAAGRGEASEFYAWFGAAYCNSRQHFPGKESLGLNELLRAERGDLAQTADPGRKTEAELAVAAWVHRMVKTVIPRFSLDRGFEFRHTVGYGERQCFLQAVLIAGLLQDMGVDAGVVMVYRSPRGEESNNGHAVTLVKLPDGNDIIVDASEQRAFVRQQGLFVRAPGYRYVRPAYVQGSNRIRHYQAAHGNGRIVTAAVRTLDLPFIRSQFWYYRGERVVGGLLANRPTKRGLAAAEKHLRASVKLCPGNPLSVYMLGRVYLAEGEVTQARRHLQTACRLYSRCGWLPDGPREYLAAATGSHTRQAG